MLMNRTLILPEAFNSDPNGIQLVLMKWSLVIISLEIEFKPIFVFSFLFYAM